MKTPAQLPDLPQNADLLGYLRSQATWPNSPAELRGVISRSLAYAIGLARADRRAR